MKTLEAENDDLEGLLSELDPKWRKRVELPPILRDKANIEEIQALGREFGIMYNPWIDDDAFMRARPPRPSPKVRYSNASNIADGLINDLYDFVPEKYHPLLENHSAFRDLVCFFFSSMRNSY